MHLNKIIKYASTFHKLAAQYWGTKGAGILFVCTEDQTALLLKRSQRVHQGGSWGIAGGAMDEGFHESEGQLIKDPAPDVFLSSAMREAAEELGSMPKLEGFLGSTTYQDGSFTYMTFVFEITKEEKERWTPAIRLNWENDDAQWFPIQSLPADLHFGLKHTVDELSREEVLDFGQVENEAI